MTRTESSALFSLKELLTLEEARIADEEDARAKRRAARAAEEREAEARARRDEAERIAAAEAARSERDRRDREQQASMQAKILAEVERERILAERRAEEERRAKEQEHARAMAVFEESRRVRTWQRRAALAASACIVTVATLVGGYFARVEPSFSAELRTKDIELAARDAELARVARDRDAERARALSLEVQVKELQDRVIATAQPAAVTDKGKPVPGGHAVPGIPPREEPKGPCAKGDPMCGIR